MATSAEIINFLLDQLSTVHQLSTRRMFGEYCVYVAGKPVGFVCNDQLYLKITPAGRAFAPGLTEGFPYPGAKAYLLVTADRWEDREWLVELVLVTDSDLPAAKPRKK
ncbi:TfoX/Sxy family protein [Paenalcaligenes sp. Me131]|uniref:TfoX/Sxy family protein n=1 Tax=Paenalcaligenes sp. Me131 TaxID=3392636 RepID=UPI003D2CE524